MWRTITVAGGGVTGAAVACALAKSRLFEKIVLAEMRGAPVYPGRLTVGDPGIPLTQRSVDFLKSIDIWDSIDNEDKHPIKSMQILDFWSPKRTFAKFSGAVVANDNLSYQLIQKCSTFPNLEVNFHNFVEKIEPKEKGVLVHMMNLFHTGKKEIESAVVIGADGADSLVRRNLKIGCRMVRYPQQILSCSLQTSSPLQHMTLKVTPSGRILLVPMSDTDVSLHWLMNDKLAEEYDAMPTKEFLDILNKELQSPALKYPKRKREQFAPIFDNVSAEREFKDAVTLDVESYAQGRAMLLGSAMHANYALISEGLNMQISVAIAMAHALCTEVEKKLEPGTLMRALADKAERRTRLSLAAERLSFKLSQNTPFNNRSRAVFSRLFDTFASEKRRGQLLEAYANGFQSCPRNWQWQSK